MSRIDFLFKNDAFRIAAEPNFDTSHVDSSMNMEAVFPKCTHQPLFLNALVYAMVQVQDRGRTTLENLKLKGRAVELLNEELASNAIDLTPAVIGAVMILKSVAYKFSDYASHEMHSHGLSVCLRTLQARHTLLTPAAARAIFWQDLFSNLLISAPRQMARLPLPKDVSWSRTLLNIPSGFLQISHLLPETLLECISDTVELRSCLLTCSQQRDEKYAQLDTMQASIESRLALQEQNCKDFGVVAEAVRLGVFISCYETWTETWESALIPTKVAAQLVSMLERNLYEPADRHLSSSNFSKTDADSEWAACRDVQLWLLLLGACVAELDRGYVDGLRAKYALALRGFKDFVERDLASYHISKSPEEPDNPDFDELSLESGPNFWKRTLNAALKDFLYCKGWNERRLCIADWFELESLIEAQSEADLGLGACYSETMAECSMTDAYLDLADIGDWDAQFSNNSNGSSNLYSTESTESAMDLLYIDDFKNR